MRIALTIRSASPCRFCILLTFPPPHSEMVKSELHWHMALGCSTASLSPDDWAYYSVFQNNQFAQPSTFTLILSSIVYIFQHYTRFATTMHVHFHCCTVHTPNMVSTTLTKYCSLIYWNCRCALMFVSRVGTFTECLSHESELEEARYSNVEWWCFTHKELWHVRIGKPNFYRAIRCHGRLVPSRSLAAASEIGGKENAQTGTVQPLTAAGK